MILLRRPLDKIERRLVGYAPTAVCKYNGDIDGSALERAWAALCREFPLVKARILQEAGARILVVDDEPVVNFRALDGDLRTVDEFVYGSWKPEEGVAKLALIRGPDLTGNVLMRVDESVFDGRNAYDCLCKLWDLYTATINRADLPLSSHFTLPRPPTEVWAERVKTPVSFDTDDNVEKEVELYDVSRHNIRFDADETSRLVTAAKEYGTSVHAFACGAILAAQRELSGSTAEEPMVCMSPVDLRDRVNPPVEKFETTTFCGTHTAEVMVSRTSDARSLGKQIKDQLDMAICGRRLPAPLLNPSQRLGGTIPSHLATIMVSNRGRLPGFTTPTELTISEWTGLIPKAPKFPAYGVFTHDDKLNVECNHGDNFESHEVEHIVDAIRVNLSSMSKAA